MQLRKHAFIATILIVYLGRVMCGETFHLLSGCDRHCASDSTAVSDSVFCNSDRQTEQDCRHSHSTLHQTEERYPTNEAPHDSSECWTCHVLSESGNTSYELTLETNYGFVYFTSSAYKHFHLPVNMHSFLVRGPPVFLLQLS